MSLCVNFIRFPAANLQLSSFLFFLNSFIRNGDRESSWCSGLLARFQFFFLKILFTFRNVKLFILPHSQLLFPELIVPPIIGFFHLAFVKDLADVNQDVVVECPTVPVLFIKKS